jgi:quercetin dioxygenase-like cupin family protein
MVYVLKGWKKHEFEGQGEHIMRAGSCWIQPPNIKHTVLDYSEDCEVLEIVMPAEFATEEV